MSKHDIILSLLSSKYSELIKKDIKYQKYTPKVYCDTDFQIVKEIGRGTSATVFLGSLPGKKEEVAIKWIHLKKEDSVPIFLKEVFLSDMFSKYDIGPKFIEAYICKKKDLGVIITEYWDETFSLWDKFCIDEFLIRKLENQVKILHEMGYVHFDIKPMNILLKGKTWKPWDYDVDEEMLWVGDATIADFGVTKKISEIDDEEINRFYIFHKGRNGDYFKLNNITLEDVKKNPFLLDEAFFWTYKRECKNKKKYTMEYK